MEGYPPRENPLPERMYRFFLCTMIRGTMDHWSWSRSFQRNAPKDHVHILDVSCQRKAIHVLFRGKIQEFIGFSNIREVETVYHLEVTYAIHCLKDHDDYCFMYRPSYIFGTEIFECTRASSNMTVPCKNKCFSPVPSPVATQPTVT